MKKKIKVKYSIRLQQVQVRLTPSWKAALSMKVQHEGALTHLCIIRKNGHPIHHTLYGKGIFADVITRRISKWGNCPG